MFATMRAWRLPLAPSQQLPAPTVIASPLRPMDLISTIGLSWLCNLMMPDDAVDGFARFA